MHANWPSQPIVDVSAEAIAKPVASGAHWILDDEMATPLARYPALRDRRRLSLESVGGVLVAINGGEGIAFGLGGAAVASIVATLAPALVGACLSEGAVLLDRIERLAWFHFGSGGSSALAVAAIDLALWDLAGKIAGEPCATLAGGAPKADITVYGTGPDAGQLAAQGFPLVKITLPGGHDIAALDRSAKWLTEQRKRAGTAVQFSLDCWGGVEPALIDDFAERVAPLDLAWIEEPFYRDDQTAIAALTERLPTVPIASGEHLSHPEEFARLTSSPVTIWQPDLRWCGFTHALRIVDMARAVDRAVIPHTSGVYAAHLAATKGLPLIEHSTRSPDGSQVLPYHGDDVTGEPPIVAGTTFCSAAPGFGLKLG